MGLSIGDVEKITGISKDRLRYYEEKRLITPVRGMQLKEGVHGREGHLNESNDT